MITDNLVNLVHIFLLAPILGAVALNRFPEQYKKYLLFLAVAIFIYYSYCLLKKYGLQVELMNGGHNIKMFDASPGYSHPIYHIMEGETVTWHNVGQLDKTVTAVDGSFNSGIIKSKDIFSINFTSPGTYKYYSIPQKGWMLGEIIVEPKPEPESEQ